MRLTSYLEAGQARFAAVVGDQLVDLQAASAALGGVGLPSRAQDLFDDLDRLTPALEAVVAAAQAGGLAEQSRPLAGTTLAPPNPRPSKIVCVARNYAEHAKEAGLEISPIPIVFARFSSTLVGHGEPVLIPAVSHQIDWEGELAVIIGRHTRGRRISKAEAMDYVYGYSIFNDVTARDFQFRVTQYTSGKNFRASGPFGPTIVTADEVADPHDLEITTRLNGKVEQQANTSTMIYDIPTILEHVAEWIDLEPGDVIATGTPAGVGFKRKPPLFLKHGDTIEVEITGLGVLSNPVRDEEPA